ncbi:MAG: hypothetical protein ACD_82C00024G0001 [uncultured bacterium]|nr:MAG: hypothetical protein ACD_82C00024G0001 [uncultured bacterium]KKP26488.1 MAG: hypothetical protein UR12_C0037G0007 [candidate division TM6 bacterium GW2011_GWF2_30_66]
MNKIKNIILFTVLGVFIIHNNIIICMNLEKEAPMNNRHAEINLASNNNPASPAGTNWSDTIIKLLIKTTIAALVTVVINPDIIKYLFSKINNKYAYEIKIQQLKIVNESLKIQLEQLRLHCRDKKIIKAMEETYLKSCIQIIELQKKYLERYAN